MLRRTQPIKLLKLQSALREARLAAREESARLLHGANAIPPLPGQGHINHMARMDALDPRELEAKAMRLGYKDVEVVQPVVSTPLASVTGPQPDGTQVQVMKVQKKAGARKVPVGVVVAKQPVLGTVAEGKVVKAVAVPASATTRRVVGTVAPSGEVTLATVVPPLPVEELIAAPTLPTLPPALAAYLHNYVRLKRHGKSGTLLEHVQAMFDKGLIYNGKTGRFVKAVVKSQ